jgi:hypothetical protein
MTTISELRFLRSYLGGPRIWDAAALQPVVSSLADQGLIEPVPGREKAYQLTEAGRAELASPIDHSGCVPAGWSHKTHNHEGVAGAWLFPSEVE